MMGQCQHEGAIEMNRLMGRGKVLRVLAVFALLSVSQVFASEVAMEVGVHEAQMDGLSVETYELSDGITRLLSTEQVMMGARTEAPLVPTTISSPKIDIPGLIQIGKDIWQIIEENKPIFNDAYDAVSILPKGTTSPVELSSWQFPMVKEFLVVLKSKAGMEMIRFNYRVVYSYGGQFDSKGLFLSGITVEPKQVKVAWGYELNVTGQVVNVSNMGTIEDPLVGAEVRVTWGVKTKLQETKSSHRYYVRGDGLFLNQSDGTFLAHF